MNGMTEKSDVTKISQPEFYIPCLLAAEKLCAHYYHSDSIEAQSHLDYMTVQTLALALLHFKPASEFFPKI